MGSGCMDSGVYKLFRHDCSLTLYPSNKTPVTVDVLEIGFVFAALILYISFLFILPGYRGKERVFLFIRITIGVGVTLALMLCNFGQEWEVSELYTQTPYRAGINEEIHAHIGVKIGLRSVNITLRADPEVANFKNGTHEERINYNERFSWDSAGFVQGRNGFGRYAGQYNQEFRAAQFAGTPLPILWIAEYFALDGEGIRWGRHFRSAGWYTHIVVWAAFPFWILTNVLPFMVMSYAGLFSMFTGTLLLIGNILFSQIRNANELSGAIPFEDGHLDFHFGWCFWLNLFTGILCVVLGAIVYIMDRWYPKKILAFFGVDVLQDLEEYYADSAEVLAMLATQSQPRSINSLFRKNKQSRSHSRDNNNGMAMRDIGGGRSNGANGAGGAAEAVAGTSADPRDVEVYEDVESSSVQRHFRRRGNTLSRMGQSVPPPLPNKMNTKERNLDVPSLPSKAARQGKHHTAQVKAPQGAGKQHRAYRTQEDGKPAGATGGTTGATGGTGPKKTSPLVVQPPQNSPQTRPKPNIKKPEGATASPPSGSPATKKKAVPPIPSVPVARDDSGRSQQSQPENMLSGRYDNNTDYENQDEIQALADQHKMTPLQRLQAANKHL